jgi:nitric oxide reductase subunit C
VKRWLAGAAAVTILIAGEPAAWHRAPLTAAGGDAARGGELFAKLPCVSCHDISKPWPGGDICPNLGNIATEAARIITLKTYRGKAQDAAAYIRESIVDPNAYIVPGPNYQLPDGQSVMPKDLARSLAPRDVDDLVAFLMSKR